MGYSLLFIDWLIYASVVSWQTERQSVARPRRRKRPQRHANKRAGGATAVVKTSHLKRQIDGDDDTPWWPSRASEGVILGGNQLHVGGQRLHLYFDNFHCGSAPVHCTPKRQQATYNVNRAILGQNNSRLVNSRTGQFVNCNFWKSTFGWLYKPNLSTYLEWISANCMTIAQNIWSRIVWLMNRACSMHAQR